MSERLSPQQILSEMTNKGALPALDRNVLDACAVIESAETSFAELSSVIMRDAALVTNLLATANSVHYAGVEPVRTISAAVIRLGFKKIRALALGLAIFKQLGQNARTPDLYRLYAGAYFAGSLSMELLQRKGHRNSEEGFVTGLLMQVPRLVLANAFPKLFKEAERIMGAEDVTFDEACRRVFGIDYAVIRRTVLEQWRPLSETFLNVSRVETDPEADNRSRLVQEASDLADMLFGNARGGEAPFSRTEKSIAGLLGQEGFSVGELIQTSSERDGNIQRFFKLAPTDVEMMVRIARWGRVSTAQIAASLTLGSAQDRLEEGGESPEIAIGNFLTDMVCLCRRGADINHLLVLAQEAAFRCLRPTHVITALLDASQTVLRGRLHAGSRGRIAPSVLTVLLAQADSPVVKCMMSRSPWRSDVKVEGWDPILVRELDISHVLMAPIVAHDRSIGLQFLARTEDLPFSKQEQIWLEAIVGNLGIAFERRR